MNARVGLLALALAGCTREAPDPVDAGAVEVSVAPVVRADVEEVAEASGVLAALPGRDAKLGALVAGMLAEITVAEGDHVTKHQLLARVDPTAVRDGVTQAEANLAQAQSQATATAARLARAESAFKAGVAAGQEVDDARAQDAAAQGVLKVAKAALSTANNQVERSEVRAPFDALVAHVFMAPGEPSDGTGKPVVEIADTRVLELHAHFAPAQAVRLRAGDVAQVSVLGADNEARQGKVVAIAPTVEDTGTVQVRIAVENPDGALKAGAAARARVVLAVDRGVLTVPKQALVPLDQDASGAAIRQLAVELVQPGDVVHRQAVVLGASSGERAEVREGVHEGDRVVVGGAYALPEGARVEVRTAAREGEESIR